MVPEVWQEFQRVRSQLLSAEQQRIEHLLQGKSHGADAKDIVTLSRKYSGLQQVLRGRDSERFNLLMGKVSDDELVSTLESSDRCLLHLGFTHNELKACFAFCRDGKFAAESIGFPDFVVDDRGS